MTTKNLRPSIYTGSTQMNNRQKNEQTRQKAET